MLNKISIKIIMCHNNCEIYSRKFYKVKFYFNFVKNILIFYLFKHCLLFNES